jgi:hypothetical protein
MIIPSQLALKSHKNFGYAASLATLDKVVDRFSLPPGAPPIGDTSLTHVMRLAAHATMSPMPTAMRLSSFNDPVSSTYKTHPTFKLVKSRRLELYFTKVKNLVCKGNVQK